MSVSLAMIFVPLAVLAGPVRFWLPLLASTLAAAATGTVVLALTRLA